MILKEVRVEWLDSAAPIHGMQYSLEDALELEPLQMWERGLLLGENVKGNAIIVASNNSIEGQFRRIITIPKCNVVSTTVLGEMEIESIEESPIITNLNEQNV